VIKMMRDVEVREILGTKQFAVSGSDLLGQTEQVREQVKDLDADPSDFEDGEVVTSIEVNGDEG